ncbi:MAG: ribosome modulation factor [Gammaproteobacteria bacterium]|jgi:ribosome modulation factor
MKRQKRDRTSRAYTRGYQAGLDGRSREACPFTDLPTRQFWLSGWREGRSDQWSGFTGVSGVHKIANI